MIGQSQFHLETMRHHALKRIYWDLYFLRSYSLLQRALYLVPHLKSIVDKAIHSSSSSNLIYYPYWYYEISPYLITSQRLFTGWINSIALENSKDSYDWNSHCLYLLLLIYLLMSLCSYSASLIVHSFWIYWCHNSWKCLCIHFHCHFHPFE